MNFLQILANAQEDVKHKLSTDLPQGFDIQNVINWALILAGSAAVIGLIFGGFNYIMSRGDPGKAQKAMQTITFAIIGLIVVLAAAAITNLIFGIVTG